MTDCSRLMLVTLVRSGPRFLKNTKGRTMRLVLAVKCALGMEGEQASGKLSAKAMVAALVVKVPFVSITERGFWVSKSLRPWAEPLMLNRMVTGVEPKVPTV